MYEKDIWVGETDNYELLAHVNFWIESGDYDRELGQTIEPDIDYDIKHIICRDKDGKDSIALPYQFPQWIAEDFQKTVASNLPTIDEIKDNY